MSADKFEGIEGDFECSWWPDDWFGISLTNCCIDHDVGGSDWQLAMCVADQHPLFLPLGILMFLGVTFGRPIYMAIKRRN